MAKKLYRYVNEKKKDIFLNNFIEVGGNIGRAAKMSGITRQTHYDWMRNDARYAAVFNEEVRPIAVSCLEDEAMRRATGYEEDIYFQGVKVGTTIKYSDKLMELLLKANAPEKYRDRTETTVVGTGSAVVAWEGDSHEQ